jgi:hypothetical protein
MGSRACGACEVAEVAIPIATATLSRTTRAINAVREGMIAQTYQPSRPGPSVWG